MTCVTLQLQFKQIHPEADDLSFQTSLESSMPSVCTAWKMCACTSAAGSIRFSISLHMSHVLNCTLAQLTNNSRSYAVCCSILLRNSLCRTFWLLKQLNASRGLIDPATPVFGVRRKSGPLDDSQELTSEQFYTTNATKKLIVSLYRSLALVVGPRWSSIAAVSGT